MDKIKMTNNDLQNSTLKATRTPQKSGLSSGAALEGINFKHKYISCRSTDY